MEQDAGGFYEIKMRLRSSLSKRLQSFTPIQEDAWRLLNEVDPMVRLIHDLSNYLPPDRHSELTYQTQHALVQHSPKWRYQNREGVFTLPAVGEFLQLAGSSQDPHSGDCPLWDQPEQPPSTRQDKAPEGLRGSSSPRTTSDHAPSSLG